MSRVVCWFSAGVPSAVATAMTLLEHPEAVIGYCETGSEDEDNERFIADCEKHLFGKNILRLRSLEYEDTWDVWESRKYISGVAGAPCTRALKVVPRLEFQRPDDINVFGYTADLRDAKRARDFATTWSDMTVRFPLIDADLTAASCLALVERSGIAVPRTYALGFPHANCIPCGKASSPAYWALVRLHFPAKFARMAELCRRLGAKLAILNGTRIYIDEIPDDCPTTGAIMPTCDLMCQLVALAPNRLQVPLGDDRRV